MKTFAVPLALCLAALPAPDGRQGPSPVAVGEVPVDAPSAVLDVPPVQVTWPEPHSLLAIPAPSGAELWAWFRAPEVPR